MSDNISKTAVMTVFAVVISLWSLTFVSAYAFKWSDLATAGDAFGVVNSLFSGLAFAGVLVALMMQRIELRLQREELLATRDELKLQRDEMKRSADSQQKSEKAFTQQAESLFLSAYLDGLRAYRDAANAITAASSSTRLRKTIGTIQAAKSTALLRQIIDTLQPDLDRISGIPLNTNRISDHYTALELILTRATDLFNIAIKMDETLPADQINRQCTDLLDAIDHTFRCEFLDSSAATRVSQWIHSTRRKLNDLSLARHTIQEMRSLIRQSSEELIDLISELAD